jgi:hypothetical protein
MRGRDVVMSEIAELLKRLEHEDPVAFRACAERIRTLYRAVERKSTKRG